jgi:glyoxylase-like metal-dependent hydrolase (beta-lactamase superfamily II)
VKKCYLGVSFSLTLLFVLTSSFAANSQSEEMNLQKVTENLYMVSDAVAGNVAFLVTEEGVLCADAKYFPYQGEKVVEMIRQTSDKPIKYLVYTHWHSDHTRGAQSFPSSTVIIAHQNTLGLMEKEGPPRVERDRTVTFPGQLKALEEKVARLKAEQSPGLAEAEKELAHKRFQVEDFRRLRLVLPEITFQEKAAVYLGGHKVELIFLGKGHTEGDILVRFPDQKTIHFGDLVSYPGEEEERTKSMDLVGRLEKMEPAQRAAMLQSVDDHIRVLEKAAAMDFEKAIPGHGKLTDKNGVVNHLAFSKKLLTDLKKAAGMDQ